ncbi:hypothetical protein, partial [Microseira wollei]|uniref:hypothetical protein n=1 Tax=Microseira wollei TaxID=467598 RepID=UPI001CFD882E
CGEKSKVIYALSLVDKFSDFGARHSTICGYKSKVIDAVPQKPTFCLRNPVSLRNRVYGNEARAINVDL